MVPDAGNVFAYDRYMYVYGRVMNAIDPSGHLTQEEIENYFGVSTQEELAKIYGDAVAELLFEPYVTWGDVLDYDGGSAALMLFYNNGTYQGGFWGITGDAAGTPVSSYALSQSKKDKTSRNIESSKNLHNGTLAIPRRMAPKGQYYQYYFLKQTDYGVKNYALLATDTIMGIWTIADLACRSSGGKCTVPPAPGWLQFSSVVLTAEGYFSGSNWYDTYYKVHPAHYDRGPSALTVDQMINQNMLTRPTGTYEERKSE